MQSYVKICRLTLQANIGIDECIGNRERCNLKCGINKVLQVPEAKLKALTVERTIDLASGTAGLYESCTSQTAQMPGDEWLTDTQEFGELRDGHLVLMCEMVDNGQACHVCQGFHHKFEFTPIVHLLSLVWMSVI